MSLIGKFLNQIHRFYDDKNGGMTALTIMLFMTMYVFLGMAVDFMRFENHRSEFQDAMDRGILAAASANQTDKAEQTVRGYISTSKLVPEDYTFKLTDNSEGGATDLSATGSFEMSTIFLRLIGINSLPVPAASRAAERHSTVEISLVLDISGSMASGRANGESKRTLSDFSGVSEFQTWLNGNPSKLELLRSSASQFVNNMLEGQRARTTSISLIPFSGHVNVAGTTFNDLSISREHSYSSCIEFADNDYDTLGLPPLNQREHLGHFQYYAYQDYKKYYDQYYGWCPDDTQRAIFLENDIDKLQTAIQGLNGWDGTGTNTGMKWGVAMLDPDSNWLVQNLIANDEASPEFYDRPYDWSSTKSTKIIVLMSDGLIKFQPRSSGAPKNWRSVTNDNDEDGKKTVHDYNDDFIIRDRAGTNYMSTESETRAQLQKQCQLAKDNGVLVYVIGYDIDSGSQEDQDLRNCASSGRYIRADSDQLLEAFESIEVTVEKLRLVY